MIRELKLQYPSSYNGDEFLTITSKLSSFCFDKLSGFEMPMIRRDVREAGNRDGAVLGLSLYGRRVLRIEGSFYARSRTELIELRNKLSYALSMGDGERGARQMRIILDDDDFQEVRLLVTDVFLNSEPEFTFNKGERNFGKFRFELECESPFFRSLNLEDPVHNPDGWKREELVIHSSFFGFPIGFPIEFTIGNGINTQGIIHNSGNAPAETIFTFSTSVTNPTVADTATKCSFTVLETINDGDVLIINSENKTVTLQKFGEATATSVLNKFVGEFIRLVPGNNTLVFSGNQVTEKTKVEIKWFDYYIGI